MDSFPLLELDGGTSVWLDVRRIVVYGHLLFFFYEPIDEPVSFDKRVLTSDELLLTSFDEL